VHWNRAVSLWRANWRVAKLLIEVEGIGAGFHSGGDVPIADDLGFQARHNPAAYASQGEERADVESGDMVAGSAAPAGGILFNHGDEELARCNTLHKELWRSALRPFQAICFGQRRGADAKDCMAPNGVDELKIVEICLANCDCHRPTFSITA
jgi:hypothetical protein